MEIHMQKLDSAKFILWDIIALMTFFKFLLLNIPPPSPSFLCRIFHTPSVEKLAICNKMYAK